MSEKNYAVLIIQKLKSAGACQNVLSHMRRQGKELHHLTNPDAKNYRLCYTDSYPKDITYSECLSQLVTGKIRSNAVYGFEVVTSFSSGALETTLKDQESIKRWCKASMDWVSDTFGGRNHIVDVYCHFDEKCPHCHFLVIPERDGKLNAKSYVSDKNSLIKIQDSYAEACREFGLSRGISRQITQKCHESFKHWHNEQAVNMERLVELEEIVRIKRYEAVSYDR